MKPEHPLHLLVVEDNPGDVRLLEETLRSAGEASVEVEHSDSLSDCIHHLRDKPADVVLLDLGLPDGNGLQSLKEVHEAAPQTPIVILTGNRDDRLAVESLKRGAQDYLIKGEVTGGLLLRSVRYAMERFHLFQKLQEERERYELVAVGSNDGLWEWNLADGKMYLSLRWKLMLGHNDSEIGDHPDEWFNRIHPQDLPNVKRDLDRHLKRETPHFASEHRLEHKNKDYRWVLSRGMAVFDALGRPVRMAGSFTDITDHKKLEENLDHQAHYDPLTRLPNRVLFMEALERSFARFQRDPTCLFAVLFMDMDRFKFINDSLGHVAGDRLLAEFALRLKSCVRPSDLVARMGGDEFTVLLDDLKNPEEATSIAERVLAEMRVPFLGGATEAAGSVSIGVAFSNCGALSAEELLKNADSAMYRAKDLGKARYEVFDQILRLDAITTLKREKDFQRALQREEFFTLYQPILELRTGKVVGCEALLRWQHPRQGLLTPDRFIDWAEESGFLGRIDELTLRAACSQNKTWVEGSHAGIFASVNVSATQIRNGLLLELIPQILGETALEGSLLEVEVPGWMVMKEKLTVLPILQDLKRRGVRVALDHYGVGFATLREMQDLPVHNIKIGRDFIESMTQNSMDNSLAGFIITAAHSLGISVTATGVETPQEAALLRKNDCDYVQGSLFCPPLPADRFTQFLLSPPPPFGK
ncbi:MAG TPA: EAL domain-containing protein [bacterium]|nr:EAL domain-containing protein [bacterium]